MGMGMATMERLLKIECDGDGDGDGDANFEDRWIISKEDG